MPWITLHGGECDGYRQKTTFLDRPDVFFVPSLLDLDRIKAIKDGVAKAEEFTKCSRLAYEFKELGIYDEEMVFRYSRCRCDVSHDKDVAPSTAGDTL